MQETQGRPESALVRPFFDAHAMVTTLLCVLFARAVGKPITMLIPPDRIEHYEPCGTRGGRELRPSARAGRAD